MSRRLYVLGRTSFRSSLSASMAFIASLMALPMSAPSGRFSSVREPGAFRQVQDALRLIVGLADGAASGSLAGELRFGLGELVVGVAQEDQAEHRDGILRRLQFGVGPEFVGGSPQAFFEFGVCWLAFIAERFCSGGLRSLGKKVRVPIRPDKDGYLGRECPNPACEEYFKITPGTGIKGPAPCHCPYCGHTGESKTFWTLDQIQYARSVVKQKVIEAVRQDLKALEFEHKPRGPFGIGISMKLQPGAPVPIRWYREKNLETEIVCDQCSLRYAIYGCSLGVLIAASTTRFRF